jgi:hypothetical protein
MLLLFVMLQIPIIIFLYFTNKYMKIAADDKVNNIGKIDIIVFLNELSLLLLNI